jgi:hypothetical protein
MSAHRLSDVTKVHDFDRDTPWPRSHGPQAPARPYELGGSFGHARLAVRLSDSLRPAATGSLAYCSPYFGGRASASPVRKWLAEYCRKNGPQ